MSISVQSKYNCQSKNKYFKYSNIIDDVWAKKLSAVNYSIVRQFLRMTYGWQKTIDKLSISQMRNRTGYSRSTVIKGIKELIAEGYVGKLKTGQNGLEECHYYLIFDEESENSNISYQYENCTAPQSENCTHNIKEEIHISPIVPTGDAISSSKKEELKEVASRVSVTESQHKDLLKRADGNETLVKSWYDFFSVWKFSKLIQGYRADYKQIINWVIKAVEKKMNSKKHREELELKKKQEEDRQFQIKQEALQADKEKQRLEKEKAFIEKVEANRPIVEKYIEKYPGIVRISGMIWNGVCEVVDKLHRISHLNFTDENFEGQLRQKLGEIGCLC